MDKTICTKVRIYSKVCNDEADGLNGP